MSVSPRQLLHRGSVEASALLFGPELPEAEARARILALWARGVTLRRVPEGLLLRLPAPARLPCATAPGLPLVLQAGVLSSAPLAPDELAALAPPPGAIVLVQAGSAANLGAGIAEDPATWLDTSSFHAVEVTSLGALPAAPPPPPEPPLVDVRAALGPAVPAADPEAARILAAVQARLAAAREGRAVPRDPGDRVGIGGRLGAAAGALLGLLAGAFGGPAAGQAAGSPGLLARLFSWLGDSGAAASGSPGNGRARRGGALGPPAPPPWHAVLGAALRRLATRLLEASRLTALLGRRQAEYLRSLEEMFERGDLDAALRHAIPLGGEADPAPALGVPSPRALLEISPAAARASSTFGLGDALFAHLRQRYRTAFQRLSREGRIEEAAFVLAELLHASEEAVAFLERHGKLELAAELAEGRGLAPGLVVRQWFLAGKPEHAVRLARRTGAFADAIARLERSHPEQARKLRLLWADTLASSGDFAAAVHAAWPVPEARRLCGSWIDRALAGGGLVAARLLPRKLGASPEAFEEVRDRVVALLEDEAPEAPLLVRTFADALAAEPPSPALATLARPLLRALLRDRARGTNRLARGDLDRFAALSGDRTLSVDLPQLPALSPSSLRTLPAPLRIELPPEDAGTRPILDVARLPGGRFLLALGEAGALVITRDGRPVHKLDVPTHSLVVSDHGDRALALAPRGEVTTLSRLDLASGHASRWVETRLTAHAPSHDGAAWFVGVDDAVLALDLLSGPLSTLWRVGGLGGPAHALARSEARLHFLAGGEAQERWAYELPSLTLRSRDPVAPGDGPVAALFSHGLVVRASPPGGVTAEAIRVTVQLERGASRELLLPAAGGYPSTPVVSAGWAAVPVRFEERTELHLVDLGAGLLRLTVVLGSATVVAARFDREVLTAADDRGRVVAVDLESGAVIHDLRI